MLLHTLTHCLFTAYSTDNEQETGKQKHVKKKRAYITRMHVGLISDKDVLCEKGSSKNSPEGWLACEL